MPRYIDADLLMKEFCDFVRPSNNSDFAPVPNWNDAVSLVESAPTADVVERKDLDEITETHERIGYDRGFRDGYAQAVKDASKLVGLNTWAGARITAFMQLPEPYKEKKSDGEIH